MDETLRNLIRRSDVVAVATMRRSSITKVGETEFLRAETEVREVLKGITPFNKALPVDIRTAGKETPILDTGRDYVLFLKLLADGRATLVAGVRPLAVPSTDSDKFLRELRESVALYERNPSDRELKGQVFEMLASGIPFFSGDATRLALEIPEWTQAELDQLITVLASETGQRTITGDERVNAEAVIAKVGEPVRIAAFARTEYRLGAGDGIYYGLLERKNGSQDAVLGDLLNDPDDEIKIGGLRLAGLLRRADIIDSFEKRSAATNSHAVRSAIIDARALVGRDF